MFLSFGNNNNVTSINVGSLFKHNLLLNMTFVLFYGTTTVTLRQPQRQYTNTPWLHCDRGPAAAFFLEQQACEIAILPKVS